MRQGRISDVKVEGIRLSDIAEVYGCFFDTDGDRMFNVSYKDFPAPRGKLEAPQPVGANEGALIVLKSGEAVLVLETKSEIEALRRGWAEQRERQERNQQQKPKP